MKLMDCYRECRKQHKTKHCLLNCMTMKPKPQTSMHDILHTQTGCAHTNIYVGDAHLDPVSLGPIQRFLAQDETDLQTYIAEKHDCENFALRLQYMAHEYFLKEGLNAAFCEIWGPALIKGKIVQHGFNGFVAPDLILRLIEPQTDWIYSIKDYLRGTPALIIMR